MGGSFSVSGPTLYWYIFQSVWDELGLLHHSACSFYLSSWALLFLEASKDIQGTPTPPLLFLGQRHPQTIELGLSYKIITAAVIYNNIYQSILTFPSCAWYILKLLLEDNW